jgi:hypothetical protein
VSHNFTTIDALEAIYCYANLSSSLTKRPIWEIWDRIPNAWKEKIKELKAEDTFKLREDYVKSWI